MSSSELWEAGLAQEQVHTRIKYRKYKCLADKSKAPQRQLRSVLLSKLLGIFAGFTAPAPCVYPGGGGRLTSWPYGWSHMRQGREDSDSWEEGGKHRL